MKLTESPANFPTLAQDLVQRSRILAGNRR